MTTRMGGLIVAFCLAAATTQAEEWPGWRGPRGDGISSETGIAETWGPKDNVRWKTPIPGLGHSSPIVWGDRIFVTTCVEEDKQEGDRKLLCIDRTNGRVLWTKVVVKSGFEHKHNLNSFSSSTPATDGKHVYVAFLDNPRMVAVCYDFDGNEVWRKSPGEFLSIHGFCTSPVLYKDFVILNGDQDALAYIVALDKTTGEEKWRADRPNQTRSYCTPILMQLRQAPGRDAARAQRQQVRDRLRRRRRHAAVDRARPHGAVRGQPCLSRRHAVSDLAAFPQHHLMGIDPDGEGDITKTQFVRWHIGNEENGDEGRLLRAVADRLRRLLLRRVRSGLPGLHRGPDGQAAVDGKARQHHSASPVLIEGKMYFLDDDGTMWVLKASRNFEVLHKNELKEECYASPAVSHGELFIRTLNNLYCIETQK